MSAALNISHSGGSGAEGIAGALLKAVATLAVAGGATAVVVGRAGAATTAAGVAGAGVAAYAAADAISTEQDGSVISHTASPTVVLYDNYLDSFNTSHTGGNHSGFSTADSTLKETDIAERTHSTTAVDPAIAKALSNYHDMKGIMQDLGFIKVESDAEFSSAHLYGCPTQQMSRASTTFSR